MSTMLPINKVVESVSITHKFDKPVLKFLNTSDVENGKIININHLPIDELKGQAKKTIQKHDILFSEIRPKNRRFAYVDIDDTYDYVVSTKLMVLRNINPEVDNKYFYYFLTNDHMLSILQDRAENRIGSFPQITFDLLSEYYIRVPKLAEQQKIASVLSALDSKIELNNRINAELEAMAKTLYDYWFVQFDFPDKNGKPYKTSGGKMVWNDELKREIPEGWEVQKIDKIIEVKDGTHDSPKPTSEGFRLITSKNLKVEGLDFEDSNFISEEDYISINKRSKVETGDILFSMIGSIGTIYKIEEDEINFAVKNVALYKTSGKLEYKNFIYMYLRSYDMHRYMTNVISGSIQKFIGLGALRSMPIFINNEMIKKYDDATKHIFKRLINIKIQNQKVTELRDWLLPMLMNGQVKVDDEKEMELLMAAEPAATYKKSRT